jgi:hypothetical protein
MLLFVLFEGHGFESDIEGTKRLIGFYCNRRVETTSVEKIDPTAAIDSIFEELRAQGVVPTPQARIEMERASDYEPKHDALIHGFTFFPEEGGFRRLLSRLLNRK